MTTALLICAANLFAATTSHVDPFVGTTFTGHTFPSACVPSAATGRTAESCNCGWEFSRDRTTWKPVELPHDWAIEGPFDVEKGDPATAKLPWKGVGYYRKTFVLDAAPKGRRVFLELDGVMCDGTVFVNGQPCAHRTYGYLGMTADMTPYLYAGTNTVVVRADTTKLRSRWYPGAGIYRNVRKVETDDIYIDRRDVSISTPVVTDESATVLVNVGVTNRRLTDEHPSVTVEILSPGGERVARSDSRTLLVEAGSTGDLAISVDIPKPERWRMEDDAKLYTTVVSVASEDGRAKDSVSFRTGIRDFRFDAERGFFLNGERVQLRGSCLHSDLGVLGMAFNKSAMRRQLRILKDMGCNAIRTSHNPPAPELLDLCDEMGMFVWDECFDKWNETCGRGDEPLEEFVESNLRDFVRRDRNHPCVFVWSIGNEIPSGGGYAPGQETWNIPHTLGTTAERCTRFRDVVRSEDPEGGRPVGIGSCFTQAVGRGDYANLDITGWNYGAQYRVMKKAYPDKPLIYSESASAFSVYGYYADRLPTNKVDYAVKDFSVDSYDRNSASWSDIADREFDRMAKDKYVAGEFVWTGIDYLGEPSPYAGDWVEGLEGGLKPANRARSSYFGIFDLLGFPKDRVYLYRSHWRKDVFTLHIVPDHWTFPARVGKKLPVYVYTSADEAELFVNGVSQGRRRKGITAETRRDYYACTARYRLMWDDVVYQSGEVTCVAYAADGSVLGRETLRTAGAAASVVLAPESQTLPDDREELVFVKVTLADAKGTPVPADNRRIAFRIEGPGEIVSVGNGDPQGRDSFKATASHPLHNGRAGLVLRRTGTGPVRLTASAPGLTSAIHNF